MARVGFDWLTVELEHTPVTFETAARSFAIIAASGVVPLARVPWNHGENIKRVLDTGAWGIVVPMVNSRAEAEAAVAAARYAPLGKRTIGGQLHAANFATDACTYYARANDEILVVIMAEHIEAIEAADEIEIFSRREKKRPGTEVERKIQCAESSRENARPERNGAADDNACAAAGATFFECGDCAGHVLFVDARIGVYEK